MSVAAPARHAREVALIRYPQGLPRVADFEVRDALIPAVPAGGVLIRILRLSVDPAMRTWASGSPGRGEPLALGSVMRAYAVGEVVSSDHPRYPSGTRVVGPFGMRSWHASDGSDIRRVVPTDLDPVEAALGVVGHIGLTAHIGLRRIAQVAPEDTVVVTSAAGAVGSVAAQIAQRLGCSVIGIASGDKVEWAAQTYGIPTMLDRQDDRLAELLDQAAPNGVDVFFDNTGGTVHDLVMSRMASGGRVAMCGTIALDSANPGTGPRHERLILDRALTIRGFLQSHHDDEADAALAELLHWHREGSVSLECEVVSGLSHAIEALERLLAGDHRGKVIISTDPDHTDSPATDSINPTDSTDTSRQQRNTEENP